MAQGEHAEAQQILDEMAKKTPRNYLRKRLLAEAATLNGDTETALAAMTDVIANDTMPGAISAEDRLATARSHINAGDKITAEKVLLGIRDSELQKMALVEQASFAALLAISSVEKGKIRFAGLRPAMLVTEFSSTTRLDIMHAALSLGDHQLADLQSGQLMASLDAKKIFSVVRTLYAQHGREKDFREIQRQVALSRIKHDEDVHPDSPATA